MMLIQMLSFIIIRGFSQINLSEERTFQKLYFLSRNAVHRICQFIYPKTVKSVICRETPFIYNIY